MPTHVKISIEPRIRELFLNSTNRYTMLNIQILFTNYDIIPDFLNLAFCSEYLISNYFDSNRAFTIILCIQAFLDRGYFWALFQIPPAIIYKNISRFIIRSCANGDSNMACYFRFKNNRRL
jgi:hypothetical protein